MATTITEHASSRRTSRGAASTAFSDAKNSSRLRDRVIRKQHPDRDLYQRRRLGRTGSRQVISVRGRRITTQPRDSRKIAAVTLMIILVVSGIIVAMFLSGVSTSTSLQLDVAQTREKELQNELEVLERDVAYMKSTGAIAQSAVAAGMVSPKQPAVLTLDAEGNTVEVRPGDGAALSISDLNGAAPTNPHTPSSNPSETENVPGMQAPAIQEGNAGGAGLPATAPYAPQQRTAAPPSDEAPAPAEDQVPVPAPAAANPEQLAAPAH